MKTETGFFTIFIIVIKEAHFFKLIVNKCVIIILILCKITFT